MVKTVPPLYFIYKSAIISHTLFGDYKKELTKYCDSNMLKLKEISYIHSDAYAAGELKHGPIALIEKGDSIICFNFRPDRARQISRMFSQENFPFTDAKTGATLGFERKTGFLAPCYVGFAVYDSSFENVGVAFPPDEITNTLPQYLSSLGLMLSLLAFDLCLQVMLPLLLLILSSAQ